MFRKKRHIFKSIWMTKFPTVWKKLPYSYLRIVQYVPSSLDIFNSNLVILLEVQCQKRILSVRNLWDGGHVLRNIFYLIHPLIVIIIFILLNRRLKQFSWKKKINPLPWYMLAKQIPNSYVWPLVFLCHCHWKGNFKAPFINLLINSE